MPNFSKVLQIAIQIQKIPTVDEQIWNKILGSSISTFQNSKINEKRMVNDTMCIFDLHKK